MKFVIVVFSFLLAGAFAQSQIRDAINNIDCSLFTQAYYDSIRPQLEQALATIAANSKCFLIEIY